MKFLILLFSITPFLTYAQTDTSGAKEFYKSIQKQFEIIDSSRYILHDIDSIEIKSDKIFSILEKNKEFIFNLPDTVNFDLLYITKSIDKRFCLVSWDTRLGGTNIDFASVVLYKANNKIYYQKQVEYSEDSSNDNPQFYYTEVYSIKLDTNSIYIARGFG